MMKMPINTDSVSCESGDLFMKKQHSKIAIRVKKILYANGEMWYYIYIREIQRKTKKSLEGQRKSEETKNGKDEGKCKETY